MGFKFTGAKTVLEQKTAPSDQIYAMIQFKYFTTTPRNSMDTFKILAVVIKKLISIRFVRSLISKITEKINLNWEITF